MQIYRQKYILICFMMYITEISYNDLTFEGI